MRSLNDPRQGRPARALQRVGATGETKKAAQRLFGNQALTVIRMPVTRLKRKERRTGFRQSRCDRSTILARARFQPFNR